MKCTYTGTSDATPEAYGRSTDKDLQESMNGRSSRFEYDTYGSKRTIINKHVYVSACRQPMH
jgi:hypothetical protein